MAMALILIMIAAPLLLGYFFRSSGAVVFLSLLGGIALQSMVESVKTIPEPMAGFFLNPASEVFVISLPFLLAFIFTFRNAKKKKLWLHLTLILLAALVFMYVIIPEVGSSVTNEVQGTEIWKLLSDNVLYAVVAGLLLSLIAVWHATPQHHEKDKKHKH